MTTTVTLRQPVPLVREGCPCTMASFYQESTQVASRRLPDVHAYSLMCLQRISNEIVKNSLDLGPIHEELRANTQAIEVVSGASNTVLSSISFDCSIKTPEGVMQKYIHFNLRIPGANTSTTPLFSYDFVKDLYETQDNLHKLIEHLYKKGRGIANQDNKKHGHEPNYTSLDSAQDQFIRHSEQQLVAYLAHPQAAVMLRNYLITTLRGTYPEATAVEVHHMGLHLHSTKTCCAPCEYTLVGLMNDRQGLVGQGNQTFSLLRNFQEVCQESNGPLPITFPVQQPFGLVVTVSATETDSHHKAPPSFSRAQIHAGNVARVTYNINTKSESACKKIYTTFFPPGSFTRNSVSLRPSRVTDLTVSISGSNSSLGTPKTKNRVNETRDAEDELSETFALLFA